MNVVISGASKGIGKAIAIKYVSEACNVFICGRNEADLIQTSKELEAINNTVDIFYSIADLSIKEEVERFATEIKNEFTEIDILVNNAGVFVPGNILDEEGGILEKMIETNLYSAYYLSRALLPTMIQKGKGHIINMCSVASHQAYTHGGSYSISKYALLGFSKNLRHELKSMGIKVSTISPGATMSDSWKNAEIDEHRIMKAEDIAELVWTITQLSAQAVVEDIIIRPQLGDL